MLGGQSDSSQSHRLLDSERFLNPQLLGEDFARRLTVFVVGEPAAWGMAVRNAESKFRHTHLKEKLLAD